MRILYTLLTIHLLPLFILRLYIRSIKAPAYRLRIGERFALIPKRVSKKPLIWVHAVSVGETIAATPMIKKLQAKYPDHEFCITTTTPTGSDRVKAAFGSEFGYSVYHHYLPYDLPSLISLFIQKIKPKLLIVMETELWPNVIASCAEKKIPVVLANGRMSASSAKGYQRLSSITRPMLQQLTLIAAQSANDAERFITLGATKEKVTMTGSIKFDVFIDETTHQRSENLRQQLHCSDRKVIIFASTHPGEDEHILPMIKRLTENTQQDKQKLLALIVPRHPERFSVVSQLANNLQLSTIHLSKGEAISPSTQIIIGDTMGDMLALYGLADVAFIGGTLIPHGGHNFLEAAAWSLPLFCGKSVFNFQAIADMLESEGGLKIISNINELEKILQEWLTNNIDLQQMGLKEMGAAAKKVLVENQGALDKLLAHLEAILMEQ